MSRNANFVAVETSTGLAAGQFFHKAKLFSGCIVNLFAGLAHARTVAAEYEDLERLGVPPKELSRWLSQKL